MSTWKYDQDGQPQGPVETPALLALINNGTLSGEVLVCRAGMADWVPARTIAELGFSSSPASPAPVPTAGAGGPSADASSPPASAAGADAADIEQNKVFAIIGYLGILFLVPLLAAPNSRFARYHANQGIVLFIATVVVTGVFFVLGHIPVLGRVFGFVGYLVWLFAFVLMVLGIVNAANGKCQPLPVLGGVQLLK